MDNYSNQTGGCVYVCHGNKQPNKANNGCECKEGYEFDDLGHLCLEIDDGSSSIFISLILIIMFIILW